MPSSWKLILLMLNIACLQATRAVVLCCMSTLNAANKMQHTYIAEWAPRSFGSSCGVGVGFYCYQQDKKFKP